MFSTSFTALVLATSLIQQPRPAVEMPGKNPQEILGNCQSYLRSTRASDRSFAIATMGLMGKDAKVASRQVCQAFLDTAPEVRQAANLALPYVNKPLYLPIKDILNTSPTPDAYQTRLGGIQKLAQLGVEAEPSVPIVLSFMEKAQAADKPLVVNTLAAIAFRDAAITDLFGNWLRTYPDAGVRLAVLKVLPQMKNAAGQVNNLLAALQTEEVPEIQLQAILTLGKIGKGSDDAFKILANLADSKDATVKEAALKALADLKQ